MPCGGAPLAGFRYAEVRGAAEPLALDQVTALEVHTDVRQHSTAAFSLPILNTLMRNTLWGLVSAPQP